MLDKIKDFVVRNYKAIIFTICLVLFMALAEDVFMKDIIKGDIIGYDLVSKYLISDFMTPVMKVITWFGSGFALIILTILSFIGIKNKKIGALVLSNLCIVTVLNQILKFILHRPRPSEFQIITETGYSFPSGHSMVSMAFYGLFIYLIYKNVTNKYLKWILIIALSLLIILIGISRIYLGVHYTSDVLGGFLLSIAYLIIFVRVNKKTLCKV